MLLSAGRQEKIRFETRIKWEALRAQDSGKKSAMTLLTLLLGLCVGVLVGLLGIGGGVVLVPAMVYLLKMEQHHAQGTSLFILLWPLGLGALAQYWKNGEVELRAGILCACGMLVGGYGGSRVALPMAARNLRGLFGCFLMVAAVLLVQKSGREEKPENVSAAAGGGGD
jgi:uncharacterized protein